MSRACRIGSYRALLVLALTTIMAPQALAQDEEPGLPEGLDNGDDSEREPALPEGLDDDDDDASDLDPMDGMEDDGPSSAAFEIMDDMRLTGDVSGFVDLRGGGRINEDPVEDRESLAEVRMQLGADLVFNRGRRIRVIADLLYDVVADERDVSFERGSGVVDMRELNLFMPSTGVLDVKIGRQILTWGTSDLVFLNDLFPKDWQSFLSGRDVSYLKAPSDAFKVSLYSSMANVDVVFVPRFDADRFITGERISYYNPILMARAGKNAILQPDIPDDWIDHQEWHGRLYRSFGGLELAAYGYYGYWKSPMGLDLVSFQPTFPELAVYGASVRGTFLGGIYNVEGAYYDSREDRDGTAPNQPNSEARGLIGFDRSYPFISEDLTIALQYYVEYLMKYDDYMSTLFPGVPARDELRHVVTMRITKLAMGQDLRVSIFSAYSPSDKDMYIRPTITYRLKTHWFGTLGANVFFGENDHTFYNQFRDNTNAYVGLRYNF